MAGKFLSTIQNNTMLDTLVAGAKSVINNPFYAYSDLKGTTTQYYNINTTKSTLDESTRDLYSELGENSPTRFNKIKNALIYGIEQISVNLNITDNGLESDDITGDAVVLPNTFIPYPGDFFTMSQLDKPYLFIVTAVSPNTIDTGAVLYKISYTLQYTRQEELDMLEKQVVAEYTMIASNIGTNYSAVITSSTYDLVYQLEKYTTSLKNYYIMLFYNKKVQSFTYLRNGVMRVYDPYLIEFLIRNKILSGSKDYMYVSHQMFLPNTFGVIYDKTIFSALEEGNIDRPITINGNLKYIDQSLSLLYAFPEDYYYMDYKVCNFKFHNINILDIDILERINGNDLSEDIITNIIIKYFNNSEITFEDLHSLKNIDYQENIELYYGIPIIIFCLEKIIQKNLTSSTL